MIRRKGVFARNQMGIEEEEVNPLESVPNIADVMLVFAVALMLALIANWGMSLSNVTQIDESNLTALNTDITPSDIQNNTSNRTYEEIGKVYQDTETGEMYVLKDTPPAEE